MQLSSQNFVRSTATKAAACTAKTAFERRRKLFHAYVTSFKAKHWLWPAHNGIIIGIYHTIWSNFVAGFSFFTGK